MKLKRLGDVIKITSGGTPLTSKKEYYDSGNIPWVKTGDLKVRHLSIIPNRITQLGLENSSAKIFPKNTVLIAMYGATIGNCSILKTEAATNQACAALLPNEEVNEEFLFFFLSSIKNELINKGVGGGQPNISATILKEIKIPFPSLHDQILIAEILSQADRLIIKRKESIVLLDELLKSCFLDMFGDPIRNEKKFDPVTLDKICDNIFLGLTSKVDYVKNGGYPLIRATDINSGKLSFEKVKYISEQQHKLITKNRITKRGDLLVSKSGSLGTCAIVNSDKEFTTYESIITIQSKKEFLNNYYLIYLIRNQNFQIKMLGGKVGGTVAHLNLQMFRNMKINLPPIELQNKFSTIVKKVEILKNECEASLNELENIYGVLRQKAFKGELNIK